MMRHSALRRAATFCAVVRNGTITAASHELGLSPPAVHHDLKLYARELGHPLFVKVGRRLQATAPAQQLYRELRKSFIELDLAVDRFRAGATTRPLRISCVTGFGRYRLAPALFKSIEREQSTRLLFGSHEDSVRALLEGYADIAVTYKPTVAVHLDAQPLADEELVLICGNERTLRTEDLKSAPFITYDEYEYVFARWFADQMGSQPAKLNIVDHSSELEEALLSVIHGRGWTIAPADAWWALDVERQCYARSPAGRPTVNQLFAIEKSGSQSPLMAQLLRLFDR